MKKYQTVPGNNRIDITECDVSEVGPLEVKVRVKAASLNYRDILTRQYTKKVVVPFSDGAGEIVEVGNQVTEFKVGDRVAGLFFPTWFDGQIDHNINAVSRGAGKTDGMLSDYVVAHQDSFISIPEHLNYEEASTLPCAGLTAWHALFEHEKPVQKGQTVLIQGTGGVSVFAVQIAAAYGLKSIVISSSDEKLERVKQMGATHTINYKDTPNWDDAVLELTDGKGVDIVLEVGGADTLEKSLKAVRINGVISLIGVLTGIDGKINPFPILTKSLRVFGIYVGSKAMQTRFHHALTEHAIHPVIDRVFNFDEANAAYDYQLAGKHFGKIVIQVNA